MHTRVTAKRTHISDATRPIDAAAFHRSSARVAPRARTLAMRSRSGGPHRSGILLCNTVVTAGLGAMQVYATPNPDRQPYAIESRRTETLPTRAQPVPAKWSGAGRGGGDGRIQRVGEHVRQRRTSHGRRDSHHTDGASWATDLPASPQLGCRRRRPEGDCESAQCAGDSGRKRRTSCGRQLEDARARAPPPPVDE